MQQPIRVPYHQNVYDLLNLIPQVSAVADRMIRTHEHRHHALPAAVREWYCVRNIVPLTSRHIARPSLWSQYSNMDCPLPLNIVLRQVAKIDDRPAGRLLRIMGECQNVGDWRVEFNGTDDPPVWSYDPWHRNPGQEYLLASDTFSGFVWNWIAQFHQFYKLHSPLPGQHYLTEYWAAGNEVLCPASIIRQLTEQYSKPDVRETGLGTMCHTFQLTTGVVRVTFANLNALVLQSSWWVFAEKKSEFRQIMRSLSKLGLPVKNWRKSSEDCDGRRNGASR